MIFSVFHLKIKGQLQLFLLLKQKYLLIYDYNLRSGSIFVSLVDLSRGRAKRKVAHYLTGSFVEI